MSDTFTESLAITLSLTIGDKTFSIAGGNVKSLTLNLYSYGYDGEIGFIVFCEDEEDKLLTPITGNNLITVTLKVENNEVDNDEDTAKPLNLTGLVTRRHFTEKLVELPENKNKLIYRYYHLLIADSAQVLWKQHYPCDLFIDSTLKKLITAHTPTQISMVYDWNEVLEIQYPVLSLSLGSTLNKASFYDYIIWLVDTLNGVFSYDFENNKYTLSAAKNQLGDPQSLDPLEVAHSEVNLPAVHRYQPHVLNAHSENSKDTAITNSDVTTKIRRDYIACYTIPADMQARVNLETARFKQYLHEVNLDYQHFQFKVTPPGKLVDFQNDPLWSSLLFFQANQYRVKEWYLTAQTANKELTLGLEILYGNYEINHRLVLESSDELSVSLPTYLKPSYPVYVEGKIVSETGKDKDMTYQFHTDSDTSVNYFKVSIPLWDKKNVRVAYQPNDDGGQFYFPPYKDARVLIGLEFNSAFISSFLNWGTGTALPLDSQGNQIVMGTSTTSQNIIKHSYVDSKPELQIQRTQDKDTELIQFSDGYILLQTLQTK
jgi:hypothetical protein